MSEPQTYVLTDEQRQRALLLCDDAKTREVTAAHQSPWLQIERALEDAAPVDGQFHVRLTPEQAVRIELSG